MTKNSVKIPKEEFEHFCRDVLTLTAGIGWFRVEEEEDRTYKFIEKHCPEALKKEGKS